MNLLLISAIALGATTDTDARARAALALAPCCAPSARECPCASPADCVCGSDCTCAACYEWRRDDGVKDGKSGWGLFHRGRQVGWWDGHFYYRGGAGKWEWTEPPIRPPSGSTAPVAVAPAVYYQPVIPSYGGFVGGGNCAGGSCGRGG